MICNCDRIWENCFPKFKTDHIFWELLDTHTPNIIIGCETWLTPNIFDNEIIPPSYKLYRTDRIDGYGGVLVGVRTNIISQQN